MIPRFKPSLGKEELLALFKPTKGSVEIFEKEFAKKFNAVDAVAFPYGRSALWAFFQAVGLKESEILIPAYSCSVVAHSVKLSGNTPSFVDINIQNYNMDLNLLESAINKNTRAIVATHLFGHPMNIDRVEQIVSSAENRWGHKIWVIQDCAHSFGARWNNRLVGTYGDTALYALNISKLITSIFGGVLTFQSQELADKVRKWRNKEFVKPHPMKAWARRLYLVLAFFSFSTIIYKLIFFLKNKTPLLDRLTKAYHLDEIIYFPPDYKDQMLGIEANVGIEQLKKYNDIIKYRKKIAKSYNAGLSYMAKWKLPLAYEGATYSHYVIRVPNRAQLVSYFSNKGVELGTLIDYSIPNLSCYSPDSSIEACPNSKLTSRHTINLPIAPEMGEELSKILDICNRAYKLDKSPDVNR